MLLLGHQRAFAFAVLILNGVLQIADMATTVLILRAGGAEANPVSASLIASLGLGGWILLKVLFASALVGLFVLLVDADRRDLRIANGASGVFAVLMALVIANNATILVQHVWT